MSDEVIAMFELALDGEDVKLVEEKHYQLVPADKIGVADLLALLETVISGYRAGGPRLKNCSLQNHGGYTLAW